MALDRALVWDRGSGFKSQYKARKVLDAELAMLRGLEEVIKALHRPCCQLTYDEVNDVSPMRCDCITQAHHRVSKGGFSLR